MKEKLTLEKLHLEVDRTWVYFEVFMLRALPIPYKYGEGNQAATQLKVVKKTVSRLKVQLEI